MFGLLLALTAATPELPAIATPSPYLADAASIVQVLCPQEDTSGTAVYLGSGVYITAAHVVTDDKGAVVACEIAEQPVTIVAMSAKGDWAIIHAPHYPPYHATVSCERLQEGGTYFASGYAEGNPFMATVRIRATGDHDTDGEMAFTAEVNGSIVPGMSGGAVADGDGVTHGLNDWHEDDGVPQGGVVELADTPLCAKPSAKAPVPSARAEGRGGTGR